MRDEVLKVIAFIRKISHELAQNEVWDKLFLFFAQMSTLFKAGAKGAYPLFFQDYDGFDSSTITPSIVRAFEELPSFDNTQYMLSITGAVGCGKSTLLEALAYCLRNHMPHTYPEFVKRPEGHIMFDKYVSGLVSALTFQSYILDTYREVKNNSGISLIERCPDDTVLIFCKEHLNNNRLSVLEYNCLKSRLDELLLTKPYIPNRNTNTYTIDIQPTTSVTDELIHCYNVIANDINNQAHSRVIFLRTTPDILSMRIDTRNRDNETSYTLGYIESINTMYNDLYT